MTRFTRFAALTATLALGAAFLPQQAEAQQTVSACYTRKNGTMYRVGVPNTPADCTSGAHVKETWNVQGQPGISGYEVVIAHVTVTSLSSQSFLASCPAGKEALGGGWQNNNGHGIELISSFPHYSGGWAVSVKSTVAMEMEGQVYVICAAVAQ